MAKKSTTKSHAQCKTRDIQLSARLVYIQKGVKTIPREFGEQLLT